MDPLATDEPIRRLAGFFRDHPAWVAAAALLNDAASSDVYFRHRAGERYHLLRAHGHTELRAGGSLDPDFVFRFTPASIDEITSVRGGIGDFAVTLFSLALETDPERHVDIRIVSPFGKLMRRGYVQLLLAGGPRLLLFGGSKGITNLTELRRLVRDLHAREPAEWEFPRGAP